MSVDNSESKGGTCRREPLFQRLTVNGRGRKNDLETAVRMEIASFLNIKNFSKAKDTKHKV